jgi:hypothetical protein
MMMMMMIIIIHKSKIRGVLKENMGKQRHA